MNAKKFLESKPLFWDIPEHLKPEVIKWLDEWKEIEPNVFMVKLNNGRKIQAIKCSECEWYFEEKKIQIKGDIDTCDDCLCPE